MISSSFSIPITENDCVEILKNIHLEKGIFCKNCGNSSHYWKADKKEFECKNCKKRKSLTVNTLMHHTHLPIHYWVLILDLIITENCTQKQIAELLKIRYATIHSLYNTISKQLRRFTPLKSRGIMSFEELCIEDKILFLKKKELNSNSTENHSLEWQLVELYLRWLTEPSINFG